MGKISGEALEEQLWNNYRATYDGEEYEYRAVSVRQAWYMAFQRFGDECLDALVEIDQSGNVVEVHLDKEEIY